MKLTVENLGPIKKGEIDLNNRLNIITGPNNTGKSYLTYLVYSIGANEIKFGRKSFQTETSHLFSKSEELSNAIDSENLIDIAQYINDKLPLISKTLINIIDENLVSIFASTKVNPTININFDNMSSIGSSKDSIEYLRVVENEIHSIKLNKEIDTKFFQNNFFKTPRKSIQDKIYHILSLIAVYQIHNQLGDNVIFFPAERTAINLFAKHIISTKANIKDDLDTEAIAGLTAEELGQRVLNNIKAAPKYPLAIKDYISYVNNFRKKDSESKFTNIANELESIIGGKIHIDEFDQILFTPKESKTQLELHLTSSLVKSLSYLILYLRYDAKDDDLLIIDEPELNLHPNLQIAIAKIITEMIYTGLKVIISTHSDYLIKELNNLLLLHKLSKTKENRAFINEKGYMKQHLLDSRVVGAYFLNKNTIEPIDIEANGIEVPSINDAIIKVDGLAEELFLKLEE